MLNHPLNNLNDSITHVLVSLCIFLYKGCFAEELSICSRTLKYCTTEGFCGAQRPKIETFVILLLLSVLLNENFQSVPEHQNGAEWRNLGVLEVKILKFSWGFAPNPIGGGLTAPPQTPQLLSSRLRRSPTTDFVGRSLASLVLGPPFQTTKIFRLFFLSLDSTLYNEPLVI